MYSTSTVRYIDTAAGHIYDFDLNTRTAKQVTYTSIPAIYDSYWINKKQFIARYLDTDNNTTIRSILATIDEEKASVSTATLPDDITNVVIGDKGQIYYTYITITGRTMGVRYDMEKDTSTTLFELPVSEITLFWHNNDLYGYENPSAYSTGNVFNIQNGIFTYVYGPLQGLSAHSISDTEIVITGEGRSIVLNTEDNTTTNLSLPVLAEKCLSIVSTTYCGYQKNNYTPMPDLWYQGVVSFNDGLYGFQGSQNYLEYDFSFAEAVIDMVGPYNSPDSNYVILQNKKDNSLWALSMETSIQR